MALTWERSRCSRRSASKGVTPGTEEKAPFGDSQAFSASPKWRIRAALALGLTEAAESQIQYAREAKANTSPT